MRLGAESTDPALLKLTWQIPVALYEYFVHQRDQETQAELMAIAAKVAQRSGDLRAESSVRTNAAIGMLRAGRFEDGVVELERCLELGWLRGNDKSVIHARVNLGIALAELGRLEAAADQFERVLAHHVRNGDFAEQFEVRVNLARLYQMAGDADAALASCEQAREAAASAKAAGKAAAHWDEFLHIKAMCLRAGGRTAASAEAAQEAAGLRRASGDRYGLLDMLVLHAELLGEMGHPRAAVVGAQAEELGRELGVAVVIKAGVSGVVGAVARAELTGA